MSKQSQRVVIRYAREFSTPEALQEYLHEHPKADPSKHTVQKAEKGKGEAHEGEEQGHSTMLSRLKGALKSVAQGLKNAPKEAQKFVADPEHRKSALKKGLQGLKKAPKAYARSLVEAAKHEVKEFKEAGSGIKAVMTGKKPSKSQKHAMRTVAIHMAITTAAAVLTTASPGLAGMAMGKALAKHIALKAAAEALGDIHVLQEVSHIGHHFLHFAADGETVEEISPEEAFSTLVTQKVIDYMKKIDDDSLAEGLSGE